MADLRRRSIRVRGVVQGVGFRPAVCRSAAMLGLGGFVRNGPDGVELEVEGDEAAITRFVRGLTSCAGALGRIDRIDARDIEPAGDRRFQVRASSSDRGEGAARAQVPADAAPCADCLRELADPRDRRHGYPFVSCTACGPRYTIARATPYDRENTTLRGFPLCAACRREYEDPADRRFHAETTACPACGPKTSMEVRTAAELLASGRIVAVKGVGGYQLAADATQARAVGLLRERKRRAHKPFAVMARDLAAAETIVHLDSASRRVLESAARPIVLLPARDGSPIARAVAPGLRELGVMLPSSPLHHLLLLQGPPLVVMTSGNLTDEPIAIDDRDAERRLAGVADAFLAHDREIQVRADDSVVRVTGGEPQPIRRARGYCPAPIALAFEAPPILAVGGHQKSTICLTGGAQAHLSPHVGDLDHPGSYDAFVAAIRRLRDQVGAAPVCVAHDLHPDYRSTRWALASGMPTIAVQHHHAHIASCLAEHGHPGPVIGVAFDGTGCGPDGGAWGGELLRADLTAFARLTHLRPLRLLGGEAAIRQPWRLAAAALFDAGEDPAILKIDPRRVDALRVVRNAPLATGAGRWFDAIAALLGVREEISYEGQAAVELEAIADPEAGVAALAFDLGREQVDLRPAVREICAELRRGAPAALLAARFHETMASVVAAGCVAARAATGLGTVALSGGCFQSPRLTARASQRLEEAGFAVLVHRLVPPNDGGLCLGQAAIAAHQLQKGAPDVPRHSW